MNILLSQDLPKELLNTNYISNWNEKKLNYLKDTSTVNVFIGANNSGKSRFMRALLKKREQLLSSVFEKEIVSIFNNLEKINESINDYSYLSFSHHPNIKLNQLEKELQYLHAGFDKNNNNQKIQTFNKKFIEEIILFLSTFNIEIKKDNQKNFYDRIKEITGVFLIVERFISKGFKNRNSSFNFLGLTISISNFSSIEEVVFLKTINEIILSFENIINNPIIEINPEKIFIPTRRSVKSLISLIQNPGPRSTIFQETIISTYFDLDSVTDFENQHKKIQIFTGLDMYSKVKNVRNSKREIRKSFEKFELFLKKNFFNDKEIDIVALEEDNHLSFYIDDEDLEIHNLGDGIQAIILLMFPIFTAQEKSWIFIDEPELNLHPGMQRLFLQQILTNPEIKKKDLKFFITTHSNHFLDLTIPKNDVSIYSFSKIIGNKAKEHKFLIRNVKPKDSQLLMELGVNNSSVFMANCSIWIEGITDRLYISSFLKAYLKSLKKPLLFKEDVDYSFFEYAGSNLSHYLFSDETEATNSNDIENQISAFALSNRIFLLADKDGENKRKKHNHLRSIAKKYDNMEYQTTKVLEIENLISFKILKKILIDILKQDKDVVEKVNNIHTKDYKDIGLGKFLNQRISKRKNINLPKISDNNKTLNSRYKLKFATYFASKVDSGEITWDMISESYYARKITISIYNFILKYKS
ncbi:AAA family ATPase [Mesoflavibacter sp. CH_XMU1422-2]|uniref:AAA family ATPase n=1 Tax=Mesoflavibacter sp. CH_XMU1422-2 TaxID=3107770 RepID=UPI00300BBD20